MQNAEANKSSAPTSFETKRPNILRRKQSTLSQQHSDTGIDSKATVNHQLEATALNNHVSFEKSEVPVKKKKGKTNPRKRRPSQKIILDTYVCDKYRAEQEASAIVIADALSYPQASQESIAFSSDFVSNVSPLLFQNEQICEDPMLFQLCEVPKGEGQDVSLELLAPAPGELGALEPPAEAQHPLLLEAQPEGAQAQVQAILEVLRTSGPRTSYAEQEEPPLDTPTEDHQSKADAPVIISGQVEVVLEALQAAGLRQEQLVVVESPAVGAEPSPEPQRLWLCPVTDCNRLYRDRPSLHSHILMHFDLKTYTCNIDECTQAYITTTSLEQHQLEAHHLTASQDQLEAADSAEVAANSQKKIRDGPQKVVTAALASVGVTDDQLFPVKTQDGARCWLCPIENCEFTFKTQSLLRNHILSHFDLRPFKCDHNGCGWAFRTVSKLRNHSLVHGRLPPQHACPQPGCPKAFSTKSNLGVHMRQHDRAQDCPAKGCSRSFPTRPQLEEHLSADHLPHQAVHKCGICDKRFWWTGGLAGHARSHAHAPGELVCAWPGCGRRFPQPCRLRYHLRSHTGDKPYRCTYGSCSWAFPSASKLRRHARAHGVGERSHVCNICGRGFLRAEHLREHQPRHHPHRHHSCDYPGCKEKFSNKSSVYVHKKREHGTDSNNKTSRSKKSAKVRLPLEDPFGFNLLPEVQQLCEEDLLSSRSARTHVPWAPSTPKKLQHSLMPLPTDILQHHSSCDEKQGNPLVCGGLDLDGDGPGVGLSLEVESEGGSGLPDLGSDLLGPSTDHINSLLQEDLADSMLYTGEEEASLQVLLLNEDSTP